MKYESVSLVNYDIFYLNLSWKWLNDPEVKILTQTPHFTREDQLDWFKALSLKNDYKIWGISYKDCPIGACGLKEVTDIDAEYWGYIGEKQYWGLGLGNTILRLVENKAKEIYLKSLWLRVSCSNSRAIRLYCKNGYIEEGHENNFKKMRKLL